MSIYLVTTRILVEIMQKSAFQQCKEMAVLCYRDIYRS